MENLINKAVAMGQDGLPEFFGPADDSTAAREQASREAWAFLEAHSLFRVGKVSSFPECITPKYIPAHTVPEELQKHDEPTGHCVQIQCGPPMEMGMFSWKTGCYERSYLKVIDDRLTVVARTFEEAIIRLAGSVLVNYGKK